MTTLFPTALDDYTNPLASQSQNVARTHSQQHGDLNDAVEAIEAYVGVTGSAVPTSLTYKINGVTVDLAAITTSVNNILGPSGATFIKFLQIGTGAVSRDLNERGQDQEVLVTDFMSPAEKADIKLANPVLNHTVSVQKAATACALGGAGSHLKLPKGILNVSAAILLQFSGIVSGQGTKDTTIRPTVNSIDVFDTTGSYGQVVFRDFNIIPTVAMVSGAGIKLDTTLPGDGAQQLARIKNVRFQNLYRGVSVENSTYYVISDCAFFDCIIAAVEADCTSNFDAGDNTIKDSLITGNLTGSGLVLHNNCRVINNKILGHVVGIFIEPTTALGTRVDYQVIGNSIENFGTHGILMRATLAGTGIANSIIGENQIGGSADGTQCIALNGPIAGVSINNNVCVLGGTNQVGVSMVGNGTGVPGTIIVDSNMITGGLAGTIGIFAGGNNCIISNNLIPSAATRITIASSGNTVRSTEGTFAEITAWAAGGIANGSVVYCSNGTIANPVAGGGTGCIAKRLNGVWVGN